MRKKIHLTAIWWILIAVILWSAQGVLGKANSWSPISLTAVRAIFAALVLGIYRKSFKPAKEKVNWLAAVFVAMTGVLFLLANNLTTAANAIVIQYVMPVFVIILSAVIWHKKVSGIDVLCSIIMLAGVALCFVSGLSGGAFWGNVFALLSAFTYAMMYLSARLKGSDVLSYTYQGSLLCLLLLCYIPFDGAFVLDLPNVLSAAAMGLCVGFGYICFAKGFSLDIDPVKASVVSYVEPVLNPIWVMIFIGETVTAWSIAGIVLVLATAIYYSLVNSKQQS